MTEPAVRTLADPGRRGRYSVELTAELPYGLDEVDAALERLGYEVADADQWGRSYRHRDSPNRTAEADEIPDGTGALRLRLREDDLGREAALSAEADAETLYGLLYSACAAADGGDLGEPFEAAMAPYGGLRPPAWLTDDPENL